jgi:lipoprotein signal peptidase
MHGVLSLVHRCNSGISWSLGAGHGLLTVVLTSMLTVIIALVASRVQPGLAALGAGLICGGAVGNVVSRWVSSSHCVVDYLAVGHLFIANIHDVAITVGVMCWVFAMVQKDGRYGRELV